MSIYGAGKPRGNRLSWPIRITFGALVVLQLVFGGNLDLFGASPNFLLVFAAAVAYMRGSKAGCVAGFVCGLVFDLLGAGPVGVSALLCCVMGFVLGLEERDHFVDGWIAPLVTFSVAALAYNVLYLVLLFVFSSGMALGLTVFARILAATVFDCVVAAAAFAVFSMFATRQVSSGGLHIA